MKRFWYRIMMGLSIVVAVSGCATTPRRLQEPPLRVGITPDYPPMAYKQGGQVVGIEADFARRLGTALNRPIQFVELKWDDLVPALLDSRIDVIMSGLSVTPARQVRIAFGDPYMRNSLVATISAQDTARYQTAEDILRSEESVGVLKGSSADTFVTRHMPGAVKHELTKIEDAAYFFAGNRIRMFIGDVCAVIWLVSENDTDLAGVWAPLYEEMTAWGFRKTDSALRESANRILAGWKQDGTLESILAGYMPYLDRINWRPEE